jgi:hypothetical protein
VALSAQFRSIFSSRQLSALVAAAASWHDVSEHVSPKWTVGDFQDVEEKPPCDILPVLVYHAVFCLFCSE